MVGYWMACRLFAKLGLSLLALAFISGASDVQAQTTKSAKKFRVSETRSRSDRVDRSEYSLPPPPGTSEGCPTCPPATRRKAAPPVFEYDTPPGSVRADPPASGRAHTVMVAPDGSISVIVQFPISGTVIGPGPVPAPPRGMYMAPPTSYTTNRVMRQAPGTVRYTTQSSGTLWLWDARARRWVRAR